MYKFRQLWKCQNGHKRWAYLIMPDFRSYPYRDGSELILEWGERSCNCPTFDIGEGYRPVADQQLYSDFKDINGKIICEGDVLRWERWKQEATEKPDKYIVKFVGGCFVIDCYRSRKRIEKNDPLKKSDRFEIVGNI